MAKGNIILGRLSGKIGDLVFSRVNGVQQVRSRPSHVKQSYSSSQVRQRCILASVSAAYSKMMKICDHSFQGVAYGSQSQRKFLKENMSRMREYITQEYYKLDEFPMSIAFKRKDSEGQLGIGMIVSKGTLPEVPTIIENKQVVGFGAPYTEGQAVKISDVMSALGLEVGDQVTVVGIVDYYTTSVITNVVNPTKFVYSRYVIDADYSGNYEDVWDGSMKSKVFDPVKSNVGNLKLIPKGKNGLTVSCDPNFGVIRGAGIIISRIGNNKFLRSTSILYNLQKEQAKYEPAEAINSFAEPNEPKMQRELDNSHYLDNAESGNL